MITRLRASATEEGFETIAMDAGDFWEGHIYYSPTEKKVPRSARMAGFDVVIGNHDYLMGAKDLDIILRM